MTEHNPAARRAALGLSPRPLNHHRRRRSWRARLVWWIGGGAFALGAILALSQIPKL